MNKFFIGTLAATIIILITGIFFVSNSSITNEELLAAPTTYEYYWGDGCPHCAKVAEFFDTTDKDEKAKIEKREVWNNPANASMMAKRAKTCNIPPTQMGVPLLVKPDGTCVGGDQDIINFFKDLEI